MKNVYRTHNCNQLRARNIGESATLSGWVNSTRDHKGVIFVDLRDRYGITQIVFRAENSVEAAEKSHDLRDEDIIRVRGVIAKRPITDEGDTRNEKLPTGEIELNVENLEILAKAKILPFQVAKNQALANEDMRMRYRYLDLKRRQMAGNIQARAKIAAAIRQTLEKNDFIEIETPILTASTPEGARDFLCPSRLNPGKFYALPQAPQQYKQLLMCAGLERYYQIARCFRDEDLRADRQPEFTQIDVEASFFSQEDILDLGEELLQAAFVASGVLPENETLKFMRITYHEALERWGSDKPDLRFGMELKDVSEIFANCELKVFSKVVADGGVIKAMNAKNFASVTTGQIKRLTELAIEAGAGGLAYIKVEDGQWKSPISKFFSQQERDDLAKCLEVEEGDLILFSADEWRKACLILGRIRLEAAKYLSLPEDKNEYKALWVTDFPLLEFDEEEQRWNAAHHPFTRPHPDDVADFLKGKKEGVRAMAYDLVVNGVEIGGGSLRINEADLQRSAFAALGIEAEEQKMRFGHLLEAFEFGAPPHGGFALGFDRLVALLCGVDSIREVIAFPKNNRGNDLLMNAPSEVDFKQLREYYLKSTFKKKEIEEHSG